MIRTKRTTNPATSKKDSTNIKLRPGPTWAWSVAAVECTPEGGTPVVEVAGCTPERGTAAVEMVSVGVGGIVEVREELMLLGYIVEG